MKKKLNSKCESCACTNFCILELGRNKEEDSLHVLWINSHYFLGKKNILCYRVFSTSGYHLLLFRSLRSWLNNVALCQEHKLGGVKGLHG